jgi:hypothetical protein
MLILLQQQNRNNYYEKFRKVIQDIDKYINFIQNLHESIVQKLKQVRFITTTTTTKISRLK